MYMGMIPLQARSDCVMISTPHVYGDDSLTSSLILIVDEYSPCIWGWFYKFENPELLEEVLPMYMGMIPMWWLS